MDQKPSVGRTVHIKYAAMPLHRDSKESTCLAATITEVNADSVELSVFLPRSGSLRPVSAVKEGQEEGTWHWPERV